MAIKDTTMTRYIVILRIPNTTSVGPYFFARVSNETGVIQLPELHLLVLAPMPSELMATRQSGIKK